jgi:hypothetical protein
LEDNITARNLPVGGGIEEEPPRTTRVKTDKDASLSNMA